MLYTVYRDDGKRPLEAKLRDALFDYRQQRRADPSRIDVRADEIGELHSIDGVPVVVAGKGSLTLQPHWYGFALGAQPQPTAAPVDLDVSEQMSLFGE
jgi:hypothetical protein